MQVQPEPLLYVDGGDEGAAVQITLMTDALAVTADPDTSRAVVNVIEESLDPTEAESRALSSRVEARITCTAGSVSGSRLLVPPGKHFYSFNAATPAGSVVAVQSPDAPVLFDSAANVIRQAQEDLHVFSISGQTAEVSVRLESDRVRG